MLKKIPSFWLFFILLTVTNLVPLALISAGVYTTTRTQVQQEQERQLLARVMAQAEAIDVRLQGFESATVLAATAARRAMLQQIPLTAEEQAARLATYQRDSRGVLGLDAWYNTTYRPTFNNDHVSNVYLGSDVELDDRLAYIIAATEELNPLFETIVARDVNTQWVYLTTAEGMMRLYPWHDNNYNNNDPIWKPQTEIFYTEVVQENTPAGAGAWTFPYVDCAGAGLMVTNAVPIYGENGRDLVAVMSHDFLIEALQNQVLGFQVGESGFAFLLDGDGHVIAHRDYPLDSSLDCATEINITLGEQEPAVLPLQEAMLSQNNGLQNYTDANGDVWLVGYQTVQATGWRLGMAIPLSEVVAPATTIFRQVLFAAAVLLFLSLPISFVVARYIAQPIRQLSEAAQGIEASVDSDDVKMLSTADLTHISGSVEINQLVAVFAQMVSALQERVKELDSLYAIGQSMTGNLDYESALESVLEAVQQVVDYDAAEISVLEGEKLIVSRWRGQTGFRDTTGRSYRMGRGLTGQIAQTQQPVYVSNVDQSTASDSNLTLASGALSQESLSRSEKVIIRSFLGIPLVVGGRLVGVIALVHHEADHFTQQDQRQLNKLAAQASIALDNALRVRIRENELKEQIRTLQIRIEDVSRSRAQTGVDNAQFQDLREQARALRLRQRQKPAD